MTPRISIGVLAAALSADPRAAAAMASEAGFEGLQFDGTEFDPTELSQTGRREFLRMLGQQNQRLVGLRCGRDRETDVEKLLRRWDRVLETAAGLQSPLVCIDLGQLPPDFNSVLMDLGKRADRYGTFIALRSELAGLAAIDGALRAVDCPWLGVDWDPVAVLIDPLSAEQAFSQLGGSIRHIRGRDALAGIDRRTLPANIGQGSVDWTTLLTQADEAGYNGWITVDPMELNNRAGGVVAGLAYLRELTSPS